MDTKSLLIETATELFQQKGYKSVGVNEILKTCNITKGGLYHHFPNGKEELLISCLDAMNKEITTDIEDIFKQYSSTKEAFHILLENLANKFDQEGTITGYTFSSIVSEMALLSEAVQNSCSSLYTNIQKVYENRLKADGYSEEDAYSIALMMVASIEGALMLCLTQKSSNPLKIIARTLPQLLKES